MKTNKKINRICGFLGATCTLISVYIVSSSPIPLLNEYATKLGMTNGNLALTAVFYFIGTLAALLMFARISNYIGRKSTIIITLLLSITACLIFDYVNSIPLFMLGRLVQGLVCGLASSCAAAYIVDTVPKSLSWLGATITSSAPMVGLAIGAFGAGAFGQYGKLSTIYFILIIINILCILLILIGVETVKLKKGVLASIYPQVKVPKNIRHLLPGASAVFIGTWAVGGFFQAYSAQMTVKQFGTASTLMAAAVFASLMAPNIIGSTLGGKLNTFKAQRIGMSIFFLSMIAIIVFLMLGLAIPFLIACIIGGIAIGIAFSGAVKGILKEVTVIQDRAGVLSTIYLISYSGAAIPNLIVGRVSGIFNLAQIVVGYGVLVFLALIFTLISTGNKHYKTSQ